MLLWVEIFQFFGGGASQPYSPVGLPYKRLRKKKIFFPLFMTYAAFSYDIMNSETQGLWRECWVAEGDGWDGYIYLPSLLDQAKARFTVGRGYVRE